MTGEALSLEKLHGGTIGYCKTNRRQRSIDARNVRLGSHKLQRGRRTHRVVRASGKHQWSHHDVSSVRPSRVTHRELVHRTKRCTQCSGNHRVRHETVAGPRQGGHAVHSKASVRRTRRGAKRRGWRESRISRSNLRWRRCRPERRRWCAMHVRSPRVKHPRA